MHQVVHSLKRSSAVGGTVVYAAGLPSIASRAAKPDSRLLASHLGGRPREDAPVPVLGGAEEVAQEAEDGVRAESLFVRGVELPEVRRLPPDQHCHVGHGDAAAATVHSLGRITCHLPTHTFFRRHARAWAPMCPPFWTDELLSGSVQAATDACSKSPHATSCTLIFCCKHPWRDEHSAGPRAEQPPPKLRA